MLFARMMQRSPGNKEMVDGPTLAVSLGSDHWIELVATWSDFATRLPIYCQTSSASRDLTMKWPGKLPCSIQAIAR